MPGYDPRVDGADCDHCPLGPLSPFVAYGPKNPWSPVRSEIGPNAKAVVVGLAPGKREVEDGRPFAGASGIELTQAFYFFGWRRSDLGLCNALSCRPPEQGVGSGDSNELERLVHRIQAQNGREVRDAKRDGREPVLWEKPEVLCRPRLMKELEQFDNVITVGKLGLTALLGKDVSLDAYRGAPMDLWMDEEHKAWHTDPGIKSHRLKVLPTIHPARILPGREPRLKQAFRSDIGRAVRWFTGQRNWKDPEMVFNPLPEELEKFLFRSGVTAFIYDVETAPTREWTIDELILTMTDDAGETREEKIKEKKSFLYDPLRAELLCIGIGTADKTVLVGFLSLDRSSTFYSLDDEVRIKEILRRFFTDPNILKIGHNAGSYDRPVIERHLDVTPTPLLDTILLHRLAASEMPHSLGFIASMHTDAPAWKAEDTATDARSDAELGTYCQRDVAITAAIAPILLDQVYSRKQDQLIGIDHAIQSMAVGMHENGILVDERRRREWAVKLRGEEKKWIEECRKTSGEPTLNPQSTDQVREIIFNNWHLPIFEYTDKTGEPSTLDDVLIKLITLPKIQPERKAFLKALRMVRKRRKLRSTYVTALAPAPVGFTCKDGRVRPQFLAHGTLSGRLSSKAPNAQNIPGVMRDMFVPALGHAFVGADMDQLELRVAVAVCQAQGYIKAFRDKIDAHGLMCLRVWGDNYRNKEGFVADGVKPEKGSVASRMRDYLKMMTYAALYQATIATIHEQIVSSEDPNTNELLFSDFKVDATRLAYKTWLEFAPEFRKWWEDSLFIFRQQGFISEPLLGRRRDCLDGEDIHEISNFLCQAAAASAVNLIALDLMQEFPFGYAGPGTGILAQVHDSFLLEVPEAQVESVKKRVTEIMTRDFPQLPNVTFTSEATSSNVSWAKV